MDKKLQPISFRPTRGDEKLLKLLAKKLKAQRSEVIRWSLLAYANKVLGIAERSE